MLKIITALPGGGKTTYIYENLRAAAERAKTFAPRQMFLTDGEENKRLPKTVIIVPEQFHFETERILYKKLGARIIGNVEITSFSKLSAEIVAAYGKAKPYADTTIREITMFRVLCRLGREKAFRGYVNLNRGIKPDSAVSILKTIEDFQREGISAETLTEASGLNPRLQRKIDDLAKIYKAYSVELAEDYSDSRDDTVKAAELALINGYFTGRDIFADGFDSFTGSQTMLLKTALRTCESITAAFLADKYPTENMVYKTTEFLIEKMIKYARECGRKTEIINLSKNGENQINPRKPAVYPAFIAKDVYSECEYIAAAVRQLVINENYSFNDIAVIMRERSPEVTAVLNSAFKRYDICAFSDIPSPVIEKPLVRFMITALEAASFKPEKLLLYIKSGFVRIGGYKGGRRLKKRSLKLKNANEGIYDTRGGYSLKTSRLSEQAISLLEEAALKYRLRSRDWLRPFPHENQLLHSLEPIRKAIIEPLEKFGKKLKNTTGDKITEALADFLINKLEIQRTVTGLVNRHTPALKSGFKIDRSLNDEYRQLWEIIISTLEAMRAALLDYPVSAEEYVLILTSVLGKAEIAKPPQVIDAVTAGDALRSRTEGIKVAFIQGFNRGIFPKSIKGGDEFSSDEIEELLKSGIEISGNRTEKYLRERFLINKTLFCPSERLYISAPLSGISWNRLEPSPMLYEICEKTITADDLPISFFASTVTAAENILALNMSEQEVAETLKSVLNTVGAADKIELFEQARKERSYLHKIDEEAACVLLETKTISPSRIELLNSCRFKYFCEAGLKLQPFIAENETDLNRIQRGNLIHYSLFRVLSEYKDNLSEFTALDSFQTAELAEKYINEFTEKELMSGYARSTRQRIILASYKPRIAALLGALRQEAEVSAFKPYALEESFSFAFAGLTVVGKTDRYDVFSDGEKDYIKVVDYKTGKNSFNYDALCSGQGLQAFLYLCGILEKKPNSLPAGAFYYSESIGHKSKVTVPELNRFDGPGDFQSCVITEAARVRLEFQKHTGIEIEGIASGDLDRAEIAYKNTADIKGGKKLFKINSISMKEFEVLKNHAENLIREKTEELKKGEIYALPVKADLRLPCDYCEYRFCGNAGRFFKKVKNGDTDSLLGRESKR